MPIYASHGVAFAWLLDPLSRTLEALAVDGQSWGALGTCRGDEIVAVPPFEAVPLAPADVWRRYATAEAPMAEPHRNRCQATCRR